MMTMMMPSLMLEQVSLQLISLSCRFDSLFSMFGECDHDSPAYTRKRNGVDSVYLLCSLQYRKV